MMGGHGGEGMGTWVWWGGVGRWQGDMDMVGRCGDMVGGQRDMVGTRQVDMAWGYGGDVMGTWHGDAGVVERLERGREHGGRAEGRGGDMAGGRGDTTWGHGRGGEGGGTWTWWGGCEDKVGGQRDMVGTWQGHGRWAWGHGLDGDMASGRRDTVGRAWGHGMGTWHGDVVVRAWGHGHGGEGVGTWWGHGRWPWGHNMGTGMWWGGCGEVSPLSPPRACPWSCVPGRCWRWWPLRGRGRAPWCPWSYACTRRGPGGCCWTATPSPPTSTPTCAAR